MGDLMSKLTMRRKGISGAKTGASAEVSSGSGRGGAMDKISLMIPPPPGGDMDQEGSDDGDWD